MQGGIENRRTERFSSQRRSRWFAVERRLELRERLLGVWNADTASFVGEARGGVADDV